MISWVLIHRWFSNMFSFWQLYYIIYIYVCYVLSRASLVLIWRRILSGHSTPFPILTIIESIVTSCSSLVWELHHHGPQDPAEDSEDRGEEHLCLSSLLHGYLHHVLDPQVKQHHGWPHTSLKHTCHTPAIWKRYQSIMVLTTRLCNSFFPQAIRLLREDMDSYRPHHNIYGHIWSHTHSPSHNTHTYTTLIGICSYALVTL